MLERSGALEPRVSVLAEDFDEAELEHEAGEAAKEMAMAEEQKEKEEKERERALNKNKERVRFRRHRSRLATPFKLLNATATLTGAQTEIDIMKGIRILVDAHRLQKRESAKRKRSGMFCFRVLEHRLLFRSIQKMLKLKRQMHCGQSWD